MADPTAEDVQKTIEALGLKAQGSLEGNLRAISEFVFTLTDTPLGSDQKQNAQMGMKQVIRLFNENKEEGAKDIVYTGEYTPEFSQDLLSNAQEFRGSDAYKIMKPKLEENKGGATMSLLASYVPEAAIENPRNLMLLVDNAEGVFQALEAYHGQVMTAVPAQPSATTSTDFEAYKTQMNLLAYKAKMMRVSSFIEEEFDFMKPEWTPEIFKTHDDYMNMLVLDAAALIDELPNEEKTKKLISSFGVKAVPEIPENKDDAVAMEKWRKDAFVFMEAFSDPLVQEEMVKVSRAELKPSVSFLPSIPLSGYSGPSPEQRQMQIDLLAQMNPVIRAQAYFSSKDANKDGVVFADYANVAQKLAEGNVRGSLSPSGQYNFVDAAGAEQWKAAIGDDAPPGYMSEDYDILVYEAVVPLMEELHKTLAELKALEPNVDFEGLTSEDCPVDDWSPENYRENMHDFAATLTQKQDEIAEVLEGNEQAQKILKDKFEPQYGMLHAALNYSFLPEEEVAVAVANVVAHGSVSRPVVTSSGDPGADNSSAVTASGFAAGSVEEASFEVETVLKTMIAPMMAKDSVTLLLDAPDGEFDAKSQKALQQFLAGADAKIGDIGDDPWLYTADKGAKLATNLKAHIQKNPEAIVGQLNKMPFVYKLFDMDTTKPAFAVKDGKLVWAQQAKLDGKDIGAVDKPVKDNTQVYATLLAGIDAKIDNFVKFLNILEQNNKLAKEKVFSSVDLLPPQVGIMIKIIGWLLGALGIELPDGILDMIDSAAADIFDMKDFSIRDAMGGQSFKDFSGMNGSSLENFTNLADTYQKALMASGGDFTKLNQQIKDSLAPMKDIDPEMYAKYQENIAPALVKAQEILDQAPEGEYSEEHARAASKVFSSAVHVGDFDPSKPVGGGASNPSGGGGGGSGMTFIDQNGVEKPFSVDNVLATKWFRKDMFIAPKDISIDYSDKNLKDNYYTPPVDEAQGERSDVFDQKAFIETHKKSLMSNDLPNERLAQRRAEVARDQKVYKIINTPQAVDVASGETQVMFLDARREEKIRNIKAKIASLDVWLDNFVEDVNDEMELIATYEDAIAKEKNGPINRAEDRAELLMLKYNLHEKLLSQDVQGQLVQLETYKTLLEEMKGTQYRMAPANESGYQEVLKQHQNRRYLNMRSPQDIEDILRKDNRDFRPASSGAQNDVTSTQNNLGKKFNKGAEGQKPEDDVVVSRDPNAKRQEWADSRPNLGRSPSTDVGMDNKAGVNAGTNT